MGGGTLITIYVQDLGFIFGGRCVSVTNIAEMGLNGFSWFFRDRSEIIPEAIGNIIGCTLLTSRFRISFHFWNGRSFTVARLARCFTLVKLGMGVLRCRCASCYTCYTVAMYCSSKEHSSTVHETYHKVVGKYKYHIYYLGYPSAPATAPMWLLMTG